MNRTHLLAAIATCLLASTAQADIYKCMDDSGHTTYTNGKPEAGQKNCSLMTKDQPVSTAAPQKKASATPTPASFPKVDGDTQKSRDNDRRKILETELATETKALAAAKKELAEQLWLSYYNQVLFEAGLITETERNRMKNKISALAPSASNEVGRNIQA